MVDRNHQRWKYGPRCWTNRVNREVRRCPLVEREMSENQWRRSWSHDASDAGEVRDDGTKRRGFEGEGEAEGFGGCYEGKDAGSADDVPSSQTGQVPR